MRIRILLVMAVCCLLSAATAGAREPGWYGKVLVFGAEREQIRGRDVLLRPNRPFHFYGNTVRRMHYRGTAVPNLQDVRNGTTALLGQR